MSIDNYITIALFVIMLIVSLFTAKSAKTIKLQAKADKADVEKIVDKKIRHEMRPLEEDIREIKQTTHFLQVAIKNIETSQEVDKEKFNHVTEMLSSLIQHTETARKESRENFIMIFEKLDKKADK